MLEFFVRIGSWGDIVRCRVGGDDGFVPGRYRRGQRVICRTGRGLEIGQISSVFDTDDGPISDTDDIGGMILRRTTSEDELLLARLAKHRGDAMDECREMLGEAGSTAVLLDVDQLFDAGTLIFYFLEPIEPATESLVERLATKYESRVRSRHFAELVSKGCGPSCGTANAHGGGCSGACSVCVVAKRKPAVK